MRSYRIVLPLGAALDPALATIDSVLRHAASPQALVLLGDRLAVDAASARRPGLRGEVVTREAPLAPDAVLSSAIEALPDEDLLVISPGMLAVPLFDLRLAWSAEAAPELAALSPLSDSTPVLKGVRRDRSVVDLVDLDRVISGLQGPAAVDAPSLLAECFFLRRAACAGLAEEELASPEALANALRRRGRPLGLAPHVVVGASDGLEPRPAGAAGSAFLAARSLAAVAERALAPADGFGKGAAIRRRARPRALHVTHSLGGGLEQWVRLFASAEESLESWVLRSVGRPGEFGSQLWLHDDPRDPRPRRTWTLASPIAATAVHHLDYRRALQEIVEELGIDLILVSSLIGHSLDALRTGVTTAFVGHDFYPFCPALHIYFGGICVSCTPERLQRCRDENAVVDLFSGRDAAEWLVLRQAFFAALRDHRVPLVVPSPSVERHYRQLAPELSDLRFELVEHAIESEALLSVRAVRRARRPASPERPLRAVILGRLPMIKGAELLPPLVRRLGPKVELSLVGCGAAWKGEPAGGAVIRDYEPGELPGILERLDPDLAVFLSVVPETFSFTLSECFAAGIPPLATRIGSFADRIVDGATGFLAAPNADAVAERLLALAADPIPLAEVERNLAAVNLPTAEEMVRAYTGCLDLPAFSSRAYFCRTLSRVEGGPGSAEESKGWLPPRSPLGFQDFLAQVEAGTRHHVESTRRLAGWQRRLIRGLLRPVFGLARRLVRAF